MTEIYETLYTVYRDGEYMGIINDEYNVNEVLPSPYFNDDDCITVSKLDVNRFTVDGLTVKDKFIEETSPISSALCYNKEEAEKLCQKLNELNLKKERLEAQLRADNL